MQRSSPREQAPQAPNSKPPEYGAAHVLMTLESVGLHTRHSADARTGRESRLLNRSHVDRTGINGTGAPLRALKRDAT